MSGGAGDSALSPRALFHAFALLWLCGIALRLTILSVPPVITAIQADLALSGTEVGLLSALPVVVFGLFALPGSILVARFGIAATLAAGLLIGAVGAALRGALLSTPVLFTATIIMAAGIAMMQVALPAAVRQWMPNRAGFATALYTNGLLLGEILPVALTIAFVLPLTGGSWRLSLAFWGLPLVAIAILTLLMAPKRAASRPGSAPPVHWSPDWTERRVWQFGLTFIGATSTYFGTNAFVPGYLETAGRPDLIGSVLTALNAGQMPVSLLLLVFAGRLTRQPWSLPIVGVVSLLCLLGIATTASHWTIAFAGVLGGMLAAALTLVLTLPVLYCDQEDIARVSAGMFMVGYAAAVVISVAGGAAWDISGTARAAFVPIALGILPLIVMPFLIHRRVQPAAA